VFYHGIIQATHYRCAKYEGTNFLLMIKIKTGNIPYSHALPLFWNTAAPPSFVWDNGI
jgi:hypothetical protein